MKARLPEESRRRYDYHLGPKMASQDCGGRPSIFDLEKLIWLRFVHAQAIGAQVFGAVVTDHRPCALINARLVDQTSGEESNGGVLIIGGLIAGLGGAVTRDSAPAEARIVDCAGDVVAPGLIDMRAFIGEPGAEHRETIATASAAAAAGGVTTVVARPDTNPPVDDPAVVDFILRRA